MTAYDEDTVRRIMAGDPTVPLHTRGRGQGGTWSPNLIEAIRRWAANGTSDRQISIALGGRIKPAAVARGRLRRRIPSGWKPAPSQVPHGTPSRYIRGCLCDLCTWANTQRMREYKARKQADGFAGLRHGAASTANLGCHCVPCRAALSAANRRHKAARKARRAQTAGAA